jgi:phosphatidylglycerol:prolipoprotein diacylglycerol transferase
MTPLVFPELSPYVFPPVGPFEVFGHQLGPIGIRWYALAYIAGIVASWRLMRRLAAASPEVATQLQVDEFVSWATLGVVLGGRLGYVLFYGLFDASAGYLTHPGRIFAVWEGGMSFHGGMLGVGIAVLLFCHHFRISILGFADRLAVCAPIGLGLGRVANFINGELWGRPAPEWLPWAMKFPRTPDCPDFPTICVARHPSQIYQALMEGLILFVVMFLLSRREAVRARFGLLTGVFLISYAVARIVGEMFRMPDNFLGFLAFGTTMGQVLSVPMLLAGVWLVARREA